MGYAEFRMPRSLFYGRDALAVLGKQAAVLGTKALLISSRTMESIGNVKRCLEDLHRSGVETAVYLEVNTEPTDVHVAEAWQIFHEQQCDLLIALGGGSCIDAAKAVAVTGPDRTRIDNFKDFAHTIPADAVPLIAIPTTAGTGSEVTSVTVIIRTGDDVKMMINHPALMPAVAIVDPLLTLSLPPQMTAATGVDALCHAIEAYLSRRAQPMTDHLALGAIELIVRNIRQAYAGGDNFAARERMMLASVQAGSAFSNASVTLVHGMSRPIGALFHVPHGISNAMLLPAVLAFTRDSAVGRLADIGRLIRPDLRDNPDEELADTAIAEITLLCRELNIPNLRAWGIDRDDFERQTPKMAEDALSSGSPGNNPRIPTREEIVRLYMHCYEFDFGAS